MAAVAGRIFEQNVAISKIFLVSRELAFLRLQLLRISCKFIVVWWSYERKKIVPFLLKYRCSLVEVDDIHVSGFQELIRDPQLFVDGAHRLDIKQGELGEPNILY